MADTPLELYEEAYRLHYHEKKIREAVRIYEMIIRDFPESNECGYAFIQLQKVKANDISKTLKKGPASLYPMIIIAFITGILALTIAIVGAVFLYQQLGMEHRRSTLAMIALGKMYAGSDEFALKIIDQLKASSSSDVLVSEFTSDIAEKKRAAARLVSSPRPSPLPDTSTPKAKTAPAKTPVAKPKPSAPASRSTRQKNPIIYSADSISYF